MTACPRSPRQPSSSPSGFTMLELVTSMVMLATAMAVTLQLLGWMAAERRSAERRQRAVHAVANLMEALTAQGWDDLEAGTVSDLPEGSRVDAERDLSNGILTIDVAEDDDGRAKRITIAVGWPTDAGYPRDAPVRLTAWVYRPSPIETEDQP